ncbi:hypothetical protein FRX31_004923, partial [Thalictrum thalictroides]
MQSRMATWKASMLSQFGRSVRIKAVAESIPVYTMSTFIMPVSFTSKLGSITRNFWWNGSKEGKAVNLYKWD